MAEVSTLYLVPQSAFCRGPSVAYNAASLCLQAQERGGSSLMQQQLPQEKSRIASFPSLAVLVQSENATRIAGLEICLGKSLRWEKGEEY